MGIDVQGDARLAGRWTVTAETPMGPQELSLELSCEGAALYGTVSFMGQRANILNGRAGADGFSAEFHTRLFFQKVDATVRGRREGDSISGVVKSPVGDLHFAGHRVSN